MNKPTHRKPGYSDTCGMKDAKLDTFADVDRALTECLRRRDANYLRNSEATKARNEARNTRLAS